jgi:hypothetical protein
MDSGSSSALFNVIAFLFAAIVIAGALIYAGLISRRSSK